MNKEELEIYLKESLKKLESAADKITKTQGYVGETKKLRLLIEMVKEQLGNENTVPTISTVR